MVRAFDRDGDVVTVTAAMAARLPALSEEAPAMVGASDASGDQDTAAATNDG